MVARHGHSLFHKHSPGFSEEPNRTRTRLAQNAAGNGNPTSRHFLLEKRKHKRKLDLDKRPMLWYICVALFAQLV
jgi:hypothetical protein